MLDRLAAGVAAPGGLLVVERSTRSPEPGWPAGIRRSGKPKKYGETTVWTHRPSATDARPADGRTHLGRCPTARDNIGHRPCRVDRHSGPHWAD